MSLPRPEILSQNNDSWQRVFACRAVWAKQSTEWHTAVSTAANKSTFEEWEGWKNRVVSTVLMLRTELCPLSRGHVDVYESVACAAPRWPYLGGCDPVTHGTNKGHVDVWACLGHCCATARARVTTQGHADDHGLCYHLKPCWCLWSILPLESVLRSVTLANTGGQVDVCILSCQQIPCGKSMNCAPADYKD